MKYKNKVFAAIHESASGLYNCGLITDDQMREFDQSCLIRHNYSAESFMFDLTDSREFNSDKDAKDFYTKMYGSDFCIYRNNKRIYVSRKEYHGKVE